MPTVLVTGAGRGLGLEFTRQYSAAGWSVIACARQSATAELAPLAAASAGRIDAQQLDVGSPESIAALAKRIGDRPIDVLINCAGTMGRGNFAKEGLALGRFGTTDLEEWQDVFRVNVFAPMKMAETFVENVARGDQKIIVSLTSVIGSITKNTIGGLYSYRGTKAALNAVMHSMAIDLGRKFKIIAAPIHPGWTRTDMGGPRADIDAVTSVTGMRKVIAELTPEKAGRLWMYNGEELPW